jgi:hypothetical protein
MAKRKAKSHIGQAKRAKKPRSAEQYFLRPKRTQESILKAARVLTAMRNEKVSLRTAAAEYSISPQTVKRYAGSGLRKTPNGTYKARASDRMLRVLVIPGQDGKMVEIATRDSRSASMVAGYSNALQLFLEMGDSTQLDEYRGQVVTDAQDQPIQLVTNLDELERLGAAGVLSYQSLYARAA